MITEKAYMLGKEVTIIIPNAMTFVRLEKKHANNRYGLAKELLNTFVDPCMDIDQEIEVKPLVVEIGGSQHIHNFTLFQVMQLSEEIMADIYNPDLIKWAQRFVKTGLEEMKYKEFTAVYTQILEYLTPYNNKVLEIVTPFHAL